MKNKIKIILYSLFSLLLPLVSFAQTTESIASKLDSFYNSAIAIGGVAAVVMIIVGGIYFSVSGGSADKKSEGKKYITSALWGLVLLLGAFLILNTINPELTSLEAPAPPQAEVLENLESPTSTESSSAQCPSSVFDSCDTSVQTVQQLEGPTPECDDGTPTCDGTGQYSNPYCDGGSGSPDCEGGSVPYCAEDEDGNPVVKCSVGENPSEDINVVDCSDCSDGITTEQVTIDPGGKYKAHPFFPSNSSPESAQCVNYTYKQPDDSWVTGDTTGLKYCE